MVGRISPLAVIPALAVLAGAVLWAWPPSSGTGEADWIEVNDSMAQLLAQEEDREAQAPPAPSKPSKREETEPAGTVIDINKAGIAEFDTLPGIGAKKAEAIVAYRNEHGPFRTVEDIMNVKGIGEKMFAKMKDRLAVGNIVESPK